MSLINDVLRNIEAKRPDDLARHKLQREIRALPAGRSGFGRAAWLVGGLAAILVLGAAGFYASRHVAESAPVSPPPPAPTLEAPPPLPVAQPPAAVAPPAPVA